MKSKMFLIICCALITTQAMAQSDNTIVDTTQVSDLGVRIKDGSYRNGAIFPFSRNMFFYLQNDQQNHTNLAGYKLAYMATGWQINDKLSLTGGLLAMKQFKNTLCYGVDRLGMKFNVNYAITSQLDFNMWGQYLTGSSLDSPVDFLLPQTGTGASMVLNFGKGSYVGLGAEYLYDDKNDKLNYKSGGKLKLSF